MTKILTIPLAPPPSSPTWYPTWSPSPRSTPLPTAPGPLTSSPPLAQPAPTTPEKTPEPPHRPLVQASTFPACALESTPLLSGISDWNIQSSTQPQAPELTALQAPLPLISPKSPVPQLPPTSLRASPELGPEPAVSTRSRRLRKAIVLSLNMCTCGVMITDSEIDAGKNIMKCRVPGCETVWVCPLLNAIRPCTYTLAVSSNLYGL